MKRLLLVVRKKWTLAVVALAGLVIGAILLSFALGGNQVGNRIATITSVPASVGTLLMVMSDFWAGFLRLIKSVLRENQPGRRFAGFTVRGLTGLAAFLAGREAQRVEWKAHLAGEVGHDPLDWPKVKQASGFVITGVRCRCSDWADAAWWPVDAVLRSRTLSNLFVLLPTGVDAYVVLRHEGTIGVLTSFESIFVCGVMQYGVIKAGRWYRDAKPPEPKARQARKEDRGT